MGTAIISLNKNIKFHHYVKMNAYKGTMFSAGSAYANALLWSFRKGQVFAVLYRSVRASMTSLVQPKNTGQYSVLSRVHITYIVCMYATRY